MTRLHADPVEVRHRQTPSGPEPEQFLWRGRLHVVREVLASWTEAGGWWRSEAMRALTSGESSSSQEPDLVAFAPGPIPSSPKWAQRAWGEPAPDVGAAAGPAGIDDGERDWWRVEAGSGAAAGTGVYDLCFDGARGTWSLARVLD